MSKAPIHTIKKKILVYESKGGKARVVVYVNGKIDATYRQLDKGDALQLAEDLVNNDQPQILKKDLP